MLIHSTKIKGSQLEVLTEKVVGGLLWVLSGIWTKGGHWRRNQGFQFNSNILSSKEDVIFGPAFIHDQWIDLRFEIRY